MAEFFENITTSIQKFTVLDIVDILLVALIIYALMKLTSRTRARQVLKGLGILILLAQVCSLLKLPTISWLLNSAVEAGAVFLVIIFHPEIRRALEKLGRGKIFDISFSSSVTDYEPVIDNLQARSSTCHKEDGALIVFEGRTGLQRCWRAGLLSTPRYRASWLRIYFSPIRDARRAMIIKEEKILAAGCFLPLSDNKQIASELGTRHRAALGISELSDATVIIVSEETGVISKAHDGIITRYLDRKTLRLALEDIFIDRPGRVRSVIINGAKKRKDKDAKSGGGEKS